MEKLLLSVPDAEFITSAAAKEQFIKSGDTKRAKKGRLMIKTKIGIAIRRERT